MSARLFHALACAAALACPALAHEVGLVQVEGLFRKDGTWVVDLLVDFERPPALASGATSADALLGELERSSRLAFDGRIAQSPQAEIATAVGGRPSLARLRLAGRTPPAVSRFTYSNAAVSGFFVLQLRSEDQETPATQWVEGGVDSAPFPLDRTVVPPSRREVVRRYLGLGYAHIIPRGLDHVLFVLGIFLLAVELKPVLWQVTAFTLAHTVTLALSVYGVVSLPASIVEPLIALSIVYVALENVCTDRLHAWRPVAVFGFGLLHGMGFAGVLTEIGLPRSEFVPALLAFNLGVEGGQLSVIAAAFLVFGLPFRRQTWYRRRIVIPGSLAIAAVGLYWAVQRVFFA